MELLNLDKRNLMGRKFIFLNNPDNIHEKTNPTFNIELTKCNAQDLIRYCTKLFYDKKIPVDYNKVIKIALSEYLKKHITDKDLKEIERMKKEEARTIENTRKNEKPKFDWDKSNK